MSDGSHKAPCLPSCLLAFGLARTTLGWKECYDGVGAKGGHLREVTVLLPWEWISFIILPTKHKGETQ